ncbi:MAG: MBL fold metallo-hydrolase, partial [Oscillospiraceae bacterium]
MTYVYPLCSSSKGNATYIGDQNSGILIDAGIGIKICQKALAEKNIDLTAIKAIFITHEHTDHIKGLLNITKKLSVPVYSSKETLEEIVAKNSVFVGSSLFEIHKKSG